MRNTIYGALLLFIATPVEARDEYAIEIAASDGQTVKWLDGTATVEGAKPRTTVILANRGIELPGRPSTFTIVVVNKGEQPLTFGPDNVSVEIEGGERITMMDPASLDTKLRRDIKRRKALAALGGAFSAQGANGYTSGNYSYSGTTSSGGHVTGSGTYSGYDPALANQEKEAAEEQAAGVNRAIQERKEGGEQALDWLVRKSTIEPGRAIGGVMAFELPRSLKKLALSAPVNVIVTAGDEEHTFKVKLSDAD